MSSSPLSTGCPGSTSSGSWDRLATYHRPNSNRCTISSNSPASSRRDSTKTVSGKPGEVQAVSRPVTGKAHDPGSGCGLRFKTLSHKSLLQFYGVTGLLRHPDSGGCSLGMHGSPPKRREKKARRLAAGRPSPSFEPPRRSWGPTHCVRSRLRREIYHPQRSSETLRLACKIAPICLILWIDPKFYMRWLAQPGFPRTRGDRPVKRPTTIRFREVLPHTRG